MNTQDNPRLRQNNSLSFNPRYGPITLHAKAYINAIDRVIRDTETRKRARDCKAETFYKAQLSSLASALAILILEDKGTTLFYQRSNRVLGKTCRYKPAFMTKSFNALADTMVQADLLHKITGIREKDPKQGIATRIRPTEYLRDIVMSSGVGLEDFGKGPPPELIVLKDSKPSEYDYQGKPMRGKLVDYEDTPQTHEFRAKMVDINEWIAKADLRFDRRLAYGEHVDTTDTYLKRHFSNGSFDQCGRLCGGFWQGLTKQQRKSGLTINGQPITTLDYGEMNLRLAYGYAKVTPLEGDLYAIPGLEMVERPAVKKLVNSMFYLVKCRTRKPSELANDLPGWITIGRLTKAITDYHSPIAHLFHSGIGLRLMYMESEVLSAVLVRLRAEGIVALPIHDAVIVEQGNASKTKHVMEDVFLQLVGFRAKVNQED